MAKCLNCHAQHPHAGVPPFLCDTCSAEFHRRTKPAAPVYAEELTPIGPQLVIPGCERRAPANGKPAQLNLFG